jgi:hypothetical protein
MIYRITLFFLFITNTVTHALKNMPSYDVAIIGGGPGKYHRSLSFIVLVFNQHIIIFKLIELFHTSLLSLSLKNHHSRTRLWYGINLGG